MTGEVERSRPDLLARVLPETPANPLANKIGRHSLAAFLGYYGGVLSTANVFRRSLGNGRRIWETSPAYLLLDEAYADQHHHFTLVTDRVRRRRPLPGCLIELIYDDKYQEPLAHIKAPTDSTEGVVIVDGVANSPEVLGQIWPIVHELNTSHLVTDDQIRSGLEQLEAVQVFDVLTNVVSQ